MKTVAPPLRESISLRLCVPSKLHCFYCVTTVTQFVLRVFTSKIIVFARLLTLPREVWGQEVPQRMENNGDQGGGGFLQGGN